ncbi:MAG: glycerol-3-phosphate 1-O-acyltransferase PlsY [Candidatus Syntrophosphaera sp.]|nr:glycerol-3-phosphate 1-O-acyltransferase PlsY [Candidatus Syntrophosphaera sp.]
MSFGMLWAILCVAAYLIGSIPFGYLAGKLLHSKDIREGGSGNIGATNALRLYGLKTALPVLILDILKGFAVAWLLYKVVGVQPLSPFVHSLPLLMVILGHMFPVFLGFKGGKGVATAAGVYLYLIPLPLLLVLLVFIVLTALTRYVSVGSIGAALSLLLVHSIHNLRTGDPMGFPWLTLVVVALIIFKHQQNIKRLLEKRENKLSFKSKVQA